MTPTELLALIDDYGQRMLHIGTLPGSAHGKPTGDESEEANAVYAKIKQAIGLLAPSGNAALSPVAVAAVPEIVAFLREDAKTRRGKTASDALSMAASVLEMAAESQASDEEGSSLNSRIAPN